MRRSSNSIDQFTGALPFQPYVVFPHLDCGLREEILMAVLPVHHLALGLMLRNAIVLLDFADQMFASAGDLVEMIVGQHAPLLFDMTLELMPVAFDAIPVHFDLLTVD